MENDIKFFFRFMKDMYGMTPPEISKESVDNIMDWFMIYYTTVNPDFWKKKYRGRVRENGVYRDRTVEDTISGLMRMSNFIANKIKEKYSSV